MRFFAAKSFDTTENISPYHTTTVHISHSATPILTERVPSTPPSNLKNCNKVWYHKLSYSIHIQSNSLCQEICRLRELVLADAGRGAGLEATASAVRRVQWVDQRTGFFCISKVFGWFSWCFHFFFDMCLILHLFGLSGWFWDFYRLVCGPIAMLEWFGLVVVPSHGSSDIVTVCLIWSCGRLVVFFFFSKLGGSPDRVLRFQFWTWWSDSDFWGLATTMNIVLHFFGKPELNLCSTASCRAF